MYSKTIATFIKEMGVEWGRMAAAGVMAMVPATLVTLFCDRYIVAGRGGSTSANFAASAPPPRDRLRPLPDGASRPLASYVALPMIAACRLKG